MIELTSEGSSGIVAQGEPVVVVPEFIRYVDGQGVVGTVKATFDCSGLPPELHAMFLDTIRGMGQQVHIGGVMHMYFPDRYAKPEPEKAEPVAKPLPWWSLRRWFG